MEGCSVREAALRLQAAQGADVSGARLRKKLHGFDKSIENAVDVRELLYHPEWPERRVIRPADYPAMAR
jgi:hypothetical protein